MVLRTSEIESASLIDWAFAATQNARTAATTPTADPMFTMDAVELLICFTGMGLGSLFLFDGLRATDTWCPTINADTTWELS
tara:strand:- start:3079 stop:3324 length:246 start_codon:yes stop_codon:yes gene_type:complete